MSRINPRAYVQHGRGLGNFLGSFLRTASPYIRKVGGKVIESPITKNISDTAKKVALQAGISLGAAALKGDQLNVLESVKHAIINTVGSAVPSLLQKPLVDPPVFPADEKKSGGRKRKSAAKADKPEKEGKSRKRVKRHFDIFNTKF